MAAKRKGRQRWHALPAPHPIVRPPKVTLPPDSRQRFPLDDVRRAMAPAPLGEDPCACGRPLDGRRTLHRSWRTIRSGEYAGARGEYRVLLCECGAVRAVLWAVELAPWRGRAH